MDYESYGDCMTWGLSFDGSTGEQQNINSLGRYYRHLISFRPPVSSWTGYRFGRRDFYTYWIPLRWPLTVRDGLIPWPIPGIKVFLRSTEGKPLSSFFSYIRTPGNTSIQRYLVVFSMEDLRGKVDFHTFALYDEGGLGWGMASVDDEGNTSVVDPTSQSLYIPGISDSGLITVEEKRHLNVVGHFYGGGQWTKPIPSGAQLALNIISPGARMRGRNNVNQGLESAQTDFYSYTVTRGTNGRPSIGQTIETDANVVHDASQFRGGAITAERNIMVADVTGIPVHDGIPNSMSANVVTDADVDYLLTWHVT